MLRLFLKVDGRKNFFVKIFLNNVPKFRSRKQNVLKFLFETLFRTPPFDLASLSSIAPLPPTKVITSFMNAPWQPVNLLEEKSGG